MGGPSLAHNCGWQLKLVKLPWQLNWWSDGAAERSEQENRCAGSSHSDSKQLTSSSTGGALERQPEYVSQEKTGVTPTGDLCCEAQGGALCGQAGNSTKCVARGRFYDLFRILERQFTISPAGGFTLCSN